MAAPRDDGWSQGRCRVLLYSDEPILANDLQFALRQVEGFEVMPACITVAGLMDQIGQGSPDVVLMDLTPEITLAVLSDMKRAMANSKIVLWVNTISTEFAYRAMGLGVRGILRKALSTELQVECVKRVQAGELWFEKALTDSFLLPRRVDLTPREGELVNLISQGLVTRDIAKTLMISEGTVKVYLSRLYQKVGVKDRFELALFGLKGLTRGPALIPAMKPVQFYSCFISHSARDQGFAERLHADLQAKGVSCWFAPHDMKGGDRIHDQIERAIEVHDRLLLLLSEASVVSKWVETEMRKAFAREQREARRVLFPISVVPFEQIETWKCFDNDTGEDLARKVREYFIPDFSNWKDHDSYQAAFQRLLRDLKVPH